ncbi:flagellar assembly protein FliH [Dyella sp. OK004]|uniref:FliH/SctL family protein n=1 Tax=Dyella sp. OK004 TaxID=1855292 RepID=UPI0008E953BE|nr:flagellar assembly protein FliH [Dyella sp. OK004]SFR86940.1 flagellar assembly protein FliH [Dyella sp. OK004]
MAAILTREQLPGFQRWELPDMGEPKPSSSEVPRPTVSDLEDLEREAREAGYAAGLAEGRAAAHDEYMQRVAQLEAILQAAARPLNALDDATEQELARLALVIARQVIAQELKVSPELIVQTVRQAALALPSATRALRVYLHPDDLTLLREHEAAEPHWQLLPDPSMQRGDCRLESESSRLDARVETRLAAVVDAVFGNDADNDPETEMA